MDEFIDESLTPLEKQHVEELIDLLDTRPDKERKVEVVIVGTIGHYHRGNIAGLLRAVMERHPEVAIREATEDDFITEAERRKVLFTQDIPLRPMDYMDLSPYSFSEKRGKGEKKRERAMNRRLWGKGNSF